MPTYATTDDVAAVIGSADPALTDRALEAAERRVDGLLGPFLPRPDTGLKLDPANLPLWLRNALRRAVVRQAQWDAALPADALGQAPATATAVKGPDFEVSYGSAGGASARPVDAPLAAGDVRTLRAALRQRVRIVA